MIIEKIIGIDEQIPSIRSKTPPCPGIIVPLSFNSAALFRCDSNKSPKILKKVSLIAILNKYLFCHLITK